MYHNVIEIKGRLGIWPSRLQSTLDGDPIYLMSPYWSGPKHDVPDRLSIHLDCLTTHLQ